MLNPIFSKNLKVQGQKHPGRWGIVEHQIPSIKVLFKTNTKGHKHPSIRLLSKSKTQLVNQRKQKVAFSPGTAHSPEHTMDMLWEKLQWILPLYMKPISFQSKASVVCSVTEAVFIDFCLKKLNVFSQHIGQKTNEYLNFTEQIPKNWNVDQLSMLITS